MTPERFLADNLPVFLAELEELVAIESPTDHPAGVDAAARWLAPRLPGVRSLDLLELPETGPAVRAHRPGKGPRTLICGHLDTVWPVGSWPDLWRRDGDRLFAPGVYDMKAGVLFAAWLLRWLESPGAPDPDLEILVVPDEETGSVVSRPLLERTAERCRIGLVLEPTIADRCLKVARKGSGEFGIRVLGRAAHQGVDPERGVNAVVEMADLIRRIAELEAPEHGTTLGPNVIHGGSASNVVAARCDMKLDVRVWTAAEQARITRALTTLTPRAAGARIEISGGWNRPPMEPTPASLAVYEVARTAGLELGLEIPAARWGGSSDANLLAAAGLPTVDGFGPVGDGAHRADEHIVVDELPARFGLLATTVGALAGRPSDWPARTGA